MTRSRDVFWAILAGAAYFLPMMYALGTLNYAAAAIWAAFPAGLLVLFVSVLNFERFMITMAFFVPLSVSVKDVGGGYGVSFPGEIFTAFAALVIGLNLLRNPRIDLRIFIHPVSIVILIQLLWIVFTSSTSSYNEISMKFLVSRLAYLIVFFLGFIFTYTDRRKLLNFVWAYMLGFLPVMVYAVIKLSTLGLARSFSPEMAEPFFDDHTVFGACIAMLLPLAVVMYYHRDQLMLPLKHRAYLAPILGMMVVALALSFSRAAWLSVIVAAVFALLMRLRISFWMILLALLFTAGGLYLSRDTLAESMAQNENASGEDLLKTAKSITNVSTDDSNKERLNRWASALAMFEERPWLGFGPGTYERAYGPYQALSQKTRISTDAGDRGDAHSEFFTALTEQGLPGLVIHLILLGTILGTGFRVAYRAEDKSIRLIAIAIVLGILTYVVHGGVNSFLDLDKAAALIWALPAILVAMDIYHLGKSEAEA